MYVCKGKKKKKVGLKNKEIYVPQIQNIEINIKIYFLVLN